jgi:hypothetical protein
VKALGWRWHGASARLWAASLAAALAASGGSCQRPARQDPAADPPVKQAVPSAAQVPRPAPAPVSSAGQTSAASLPAPEPLTGDGLFLCTNKYDDRVVQRALLPSGEAFIVSHGPKSWQISQGELLGEAERRILEGAFRQRRFFDFPEHVDTDVPAEREWDLRFATSERKHHAVSYENPVVAFREVFEACEHAFANLPTTPSDVTAALGIYRVLEEYAQGLKRQDPRRQMLLEWLDSLQADFSSP